MRLGGRREDQAGDRFRAGRCLHHGDESAHGVADEEGGSPDHRAQKPVEQIAIGGNAPGSQPERGAPEPRQVQGEHACSPS
jgi:hypothetical protein